jgi:enamine deaminase RidA (YjgF/YER057c/UK114 family)
MNCRLIAALVVICCGSLAAGCPAADAQPAAPVRYVPLDAPAGMSQAAVIEGTPLVYTRQILPRDSQGKLVGGDSADAQIEQALDNLSAVLEAAGSSLDKLVRLNVCALAPETVDRVRELLAKRLDAAVRPALAAVLTPLPDRDAVVAIDAIAAAGDRGESVVLEHCEAVTSDQDSADFAVLPRGGVAYLSGYPESGGLARSAVDGAMSGLLSVLEHLQLAPSHIVQLKVFLTPASSADQVLRELKKFFPDQLVPPVVFVEWIASVPVEIELVAQLPSTGNAAESIEFYDPPEVIPSPIFSRAALVHTDRRIYISSLWARQDADHEARGRDVFAQLKTVLEKTGSDLRHMAKATYYVSDDETSGVLNTLRPEFFDPQRPPAASKATVHGVGLPKRTLSVDMIAVEKQP